MRSRLISMVPPERRPSRAGRAASKASRNQADRKSTRLNSSHLVISYAVFCLKKKKQLIPLRDRDHEPEVRVDHQLLGRAVTALDALRERHLIGSGEQLIAADRVHEQGPTVSR